MSRSRKNFIQYVLTRLSLVVLGLFPLRLRRWLARALLRTIAKRLGRYRNIAHRNIALAFPEMTESEREQLFLDSFAGMGDLAVDLARFPALTRQWAEKSIEFPGLARLQQVKQQNPDKGILLVTGHLGSFELCAYCLPFLYRPISFIIRPFSNSYLDNWWQKLREGNGNTVVPREGGYREMVRLLRSGEDVGVLFDQNVARKHAIFPRWFGKPAATTKALALAALRIQASLFIVALVRRGVDDYLFECLECDCSDIYQATLPPDEKIKQVTERLVHEYEQLIRKYPETWFWIHRKWKAAPAGEPDNFYEGC